MTDYPLIAKIKGGATFKHSLTGFFDALIQTIAHDSSSELYTTPDLIENIQVWVSAMSSAANRAFRHTATLVSLAVMSALCRVGKNLVESRAKSLRQREGEQKKGRVNRDRMTDMQAEADNAAERGTHLDGIIKDWFDTVFVHRYRDVDPKIRADCVTYLGEWILTYPDQFFNPQHLRYLGWVLSDLSAPTRVEVVRQLQKIYKDESKIGGLRQFTERFRPRIVEMASQDAEVTVRVPSVDLLDILRAAGLLEPNDIDTIGRLIFDAEPRVRKAVVAFFVASVEELFDVKIEDLGGREAIDEDLPAAAHDDYESPRLDWLKLKSLVELLRSFDSSNNAPEKFLVAENAFSTAGKETRFSIAAQALMEKLPGAKNWELLAGYLLYDHSQSAADRTAEDVESRLKYECRLDAQEEIILLDVLNVSVKIALTEAVEGPGAKKAKKTRAQLQDLHEDQEAAAQRLTSLIPKLLKKFGAAPEAASAVLRLDRVLNLDVFQEPRQDSSTYCALLDDINEQFLAHNDNAVLAEARAALLHARSFDELGETMDDKLQMLWQETTHALVVYCKGEEMTVRGSLSEDVLGLVASAVLRISNLASISDCTTSFDTPQQLVVANFRSKRSSSPPVAPITYLIDIIGRGVPGEHIEPVINAAEDSLVADACRSLFFYFVWRMKAFQSSPALVTPSAITTLAEHRDAFAARLRDILTHRRGADELRLAVAGDVLDLHTIFFTMLRQLKPDADSAQQLDELRTAIDPATQAQILKAFAAAETEFAKKSGKVLEDVADDHDPVDLYDEDDALSSASDTDDDERDQDEAAAAARAERKLRAMLPSEKKLCELASKLVLAIVAGVVDVVPKEYASVRAGVKYEGPVRRRLCRNKGRLGQNFKEVVAALEKDGLGKRPARRGKVKPGAAVAVAKKKGGKAGRKGRRREVMEEEESEEEDVPMFDENAEGDEGPEESLRDAEDDITGEADGVEVNGGRHVSELESVLGD